jgi:sugar/nucleoside kinase (ribokinase family)
MGPEGSYFRTAGEELRVPAYPVTPVDGTGAGDAFVAGFLFGWLRGWVLADTARFANAVGGLATTAAGATAGVRSYAETVESIEEWEGQPWTTS